MEADEGTNKEFLKGRLLWDMDGDILLRLATTMPMALPQRQTGYRQFGANVAQWDPEAQLRWLAAQGGEGQWEQYVDPRTLQDYRQRVLPAGQAQQQQQQQQQQILPPLTPEETAWAFSAHGNDVSRWPEPLRSRWVRASNGSGQGTREPAVNVEEAGSPLGSVQNALAPVWPPPAHGPCGFCLTGGRQDRCNVNMDVGIGCTACRDANMECVAPNGASLATRPPQDRDWTQKCSGCSHTGGDCTWQHNPANLGWACLFCRTRGIVCMPLDINLLPLPNPRGPIAVDPAVLNIQPAPLAGNQAPLAPLIPPAAAVGYQAPPAFVVPPPGPGLAAPGGGLEAANAMAARCGLRGTGAVYTPNELGETPEQQAAIQGRLQLDPNSTICRTCFHNCGGGARRWCSRYDNPNAGLDACERCERWGITCIDLNGRVLRPRLDRIGTGVASQLWYHRCDACRANGRNCDRSRPCFSCRENGCNCTNNAAAAAKNQERWGVFAHGTAWGLEHPLYRLALGYGPWAIGTERPALRPDLPGPIEGPLSVMDGRRRNLQPRPEVFAHIVNYGGLNIDDLMARPDLAMRYNHPNEGAQSAGPVAAVNAPPPAPFFPPAAPNNGPGAAPVPLAMPPVPYQNQQIAGLNQPIAPPMPAADFDPFQASPAPANLVGNQAPEQLPAQVFAGGMAIGGDEPTLDFDAAAFDQGLQDLGVDLVAGADDAPRSPPSPFPLLGPRRLGDNDRSLFGPNGQSQVDEAFLDLFPTVDRREVAVASIPSGAIDALSQLMAEFCMEGPPAEDQCVRVANGECADWTHVGSQKFVVCDPHKDESISQVLGNDGWQPSDVMSMRAYACNDCVTNFSVRNPIQGTGAKVFGRAPVDGEEDDVAMTLFDQTKIGGLQGNQIHPITGCKCGSKLIKTFLCRMHRRDHFDKITRQARRLTEWRINRYGARICPFCRNKAGVDHHSFSGQFGGAHHCLVAYMCMICHGYVMKIAQAPNPSAAEAGQKQQLQGIISQAGLVLGEA